MKWLNSAGRVLIILGALGFFSLAAPNEAEAQCTYICDGCEEVYSGCTAGCQICQWNFGPTCDCDEVVVDTDPCECRQCVAYGWCGQVRTPIAFDAKKELLLALAAEARADIGKAPPRAARRNTSPERTTSESARSQRTPNHKPLQ